MPYIHKKTFEIVQSSNIKYELDDYFEVDELIALPIQELNKKGYSTILSCSGHAFAESGEAFVPAGTPNPEKLIGGVYKTETLPDGSYRNLFKKVFSRSSYIVFDSNMALPPAPDEWYYTDCDGALYRDYPEELDSYDYYTLLVKSMKELYDWAKKLPINSCEQCISTEKSESNTYPTTDLKFMGTIFIP